MGVINYKAIYDRNKHGWYDMTEDPQKYEALLAGHYSDSNHFVYELLQNAEDAFDVERNLYASKVVIEYYDDKLVFYHNGKPFDEDDVKGVSSMLMGTKDKSEAQTIGRFGMGFKSVFKYTYQPEIYSDDEAFIITRYLLPVENKDSWNKEAEKNAIVCKLGDGKSFMPFLHEDHLTKIVIPFLKYSKSGDLEAVPGEDVLEKLHELNGEILLFLSHIKELYWVNKETGEYAYISIESDPEDNNIVKCRMEGTKYDDKVEYANYLKFKDVFDHSEMSNAEVSVAYKLNSRLENINELPNSNIFVYFPTRDKTKLPFIIHGSFETAVSREKLMSPSDYNDDLFYRLADLIADSMKELAKRKLITQNFIRKSILQAFEDESENGTIPGLKDKITEVFREKGLIPCINGDYKKPEDLLIPIPIRMAEFVNKPLVGKIFDGNNSFVTINDVAAAKFNVYYNWLKDDLGIARYKLSDLAQDISKIMVDKVPNSGESYEALKSFYDFLSDNRESVYYTGLAYTRSGPYELDIKTDIKGAWKKLRTASIILNRINKLVPAFINDKPNIYLTASTEYKSIMQAEMVHMSIASDFKSLLSDGFEIQPFDDLQYIKENVLVKYMDDTDKFAESENFLQEYQKDFKQIMTLAKNNSQSFIKDLLSDAKIIIANDPYPGNEGYILVKPKEAYLPVSEEGVDLSIYYGLIPDNDAIWDRENDDELPDLTDADEEYWFDFERYPIYMELYEKLGIEEDDLKYLGVVNSIVDEGPRKQEGMGDGYWVAQGSFCPKLDVDYLDENLEYISDNPEDELAKKKSIEILKLLLSIAKKLRGSRKYRKTNPYEGAEEEAYILRHSLYYTRWVYDKELMPKKLSDISRYDLNPALYGLISADKECYEILGFIENELDSAEETLQMATTLKKSDKMRLLKMLAKELGKEIKDPMEDDWDDEDDSTSEFNPSLWEDDDFPHNKVRNFDYLLRHVQEQFFCADPSKYEKVLRRIKVNKNAKADRAYAIGMYTNTSGTSICQMCKRPVAFIEVDEIAPFGIELPQLHLCLCRDCSSRYKAIRDGNKAEYKDRIKTALLSFDVRDSSEDYVLSFNESTQLTFTQTHLAEVQEILRLLDEYGVPSNEEEVKETKVPLISEETMKESIGKIIEEEAEKFDDFSEENEDELEDETVIEPVVIEKAIDIAMPGCLISYKRRNAENITTTILDPNKVPLHKLFVGAKVGEAVFFMGKWFEIVELVQKG